LRLTLPVSETDPVVVGSTSEIEDDTEKEKTNEDQNLASGHPEFNLSEERDTENVYGQDDNNDDRAEKAIDESKNIETVARWHHSPPDGNVDAPVRVPVSDNLIMGQRVNELSW
jgi:hypothetical protein